MSEPVILEQLKKASCAEEFFTLLGVEFDPKVVNVARLHILRRMGQYLFSEDLCDLDDATVTQRCKDFLERAYQDFLESTPIEERLFKVHKDAVKPAPAPNLVQLNVLK
ncbi:MAG: nitrogenase stabilizing/protective protein NifW [Methylocystis sp.]|uniref:nitrogenase stabilizing/protective protein NifW n=1 Tax=Methylocystis sp. TaxID=1911079 RepID=UPI003D09BAB6